jgi:hypothetical protein
MLAAHHKGEPLELPIIAAASQNAEIVDKWLELRNGCLCCSVKCETMLAELTAGTAGSAPSKRCWHVAGRSTMSFSRQLVSPTPVNLV